MNKIQLFITIFLGISLLFSCEEKKVKEQEVQIDQQELQPQILNINTVKACKEASDLIMENLGDTSSLKRYKNTLGEYTKTVNMVAAMLYNCDWDSREQELILSDSTNIRAAFVYDIKMNCNDLRFSLILDRLGDEPGLMEVRIGKPIKPQN